MTKSPEAITRVIPVLEREKNRPNEHVSPPNRDELIQKWREKLSKINGFAFILDLDENLFNTVEYWVRFTNKVLLHLGVPKEKLPTEDEVYQAGGPSNYYFKHFPEFFKDFETYELLADEMRHRRGPNTFPKSMHPDFDQLFDVLNLNGEVLGSLTARPDNPSAVSATARQLNKQLTRHKNISVIHRRDATPLKEASKEKMEVLENLANGKNAATLALIDDSIGTAKLVAEYNQRALRDGLNPMIYILNGLGPLTAPKIDTIQVKELLEDKGVFLMRDWDELETVIDQAKTWLTRQFE